jgi:UDP-N-acetylmuramoyl-tripeptide--D-alanyl-D-alanine ligase
MIPLSTVEIAAATGGTTDVAIQVTGIATDSREVAPGDLFVALAGTREDGGEFADAALAAGAAAALVPRANAGSRRVRVDDPLVALGRVAALVRERSAARVVGITGSTGKTSTKDVLRALLEPHVSVVASRENENNELGVPLTLCRTGPDTEVVVAEMAMRGLGQIAYLAEIALPDVAVITSVGPVHLELLGTVERVAQAKAEILHHLAPGGVAVVAAGEPLLRPHLAEYAGRVVGFGDGEDADVRLVAFHRTEGGGEAEIALHGRTLNVPVNFTSRHDALNLTAAAAVYDVLGLPADELARGAGDVRFSRWRGEEIELPGGGLLIADCYNANPTSMAAALRHLADVSDGRRTVAVLGDMAELGPDGPAHHTEVGTLADELGIELVVAVGELARGYGGSWFATRDQAVGAIGELLALGDVVLVKGSRSMGLEAVVEAVAP